MSLDDPAKFSNILKDEKVALWITHLIESNPFMFELKIQASKQSIKTHDISWSKHLSLSLLSPTFYSVNMNTASQQPSWDGFPKDTQLPTLQTAHSAFYWSQPRQKKIGSFSASKQVQFSTFLQVWAHGSADRKSILHVLTGEQEPPGPSASWCHAGSTPWPAPWDNTGGPVRHIIVNIRF